MAMSPDDRRAIIGCFFVSACILFAPGEFRAGGFLAFVAALLTYRHVKLLRAEAKLAPAAPAPPAPAPPAESPDAPPVASEPDQAPAGARAGDGEGDRGAG